MTVKGILRRQKRELTEETVAFLYLVVWQIIDPARAPRLRGCAAETRSDAEN